METAFAGPKTIADHIGGFDVAEIADYDPEEFAALRSKTPAIHCFPESIAKRIQALVQIMFSNLRAERGFERFVDLCAVSRGG